MEYSTPSSPNQQGSSRAEPTPNTTSRTREMAVEANAFPRDWRKNKHFLIYSGQHRQAQVDPEALDSVGRVIGALAGRAESTDKLPGEQLHDQQRPAVRSRRNRALALSLRPAPML